MPLFLLSPVLQLFLKAYALYLAGEKAKEQERLESGGAHGVNPNLKALRADLGALHSTLDAFGLYIYG